MEESLTSAILLEYIQKLESKLACIEDMMADVLNSKIMLDRKDIAKRQGVCLRTLEKEPWRCPGFGKSETKGKRFSWHRNSVKDWESRLGEHRQEWERMTINQRLDCRGIVESEGTQRKRRRKTA